MEQTPSASLRMQLQVFRDYDTSGDGVIPTSELKAAFERLGAPITENQLAPLMTQFDTTGDGEISFSEFKGMVKYIFASVPHKKQWNRGPRMYLTPEQFNLYAATFRSTAGSDGQVSLGELQSLFTCCSMTVTPERLKHIMQEVDADHSGFLDEAEFMMLIIKAAGMKKRRVGPGLCPVSALQEEGWTLAELRRVGYEYKDFAEAGCTLEVLMGVFTAAELRKAGLGIHELLTLGWDCARAREAGFELASLASAGCSVQRIRFAGWDDASSAMSLKRLGFDASSLRHGGFSLSELQLAGYSLADLRLAGFAPASLSAMQQMLKSAPSSVRSIKSRVESDQRAEG